MNKTLSAFMGALCVLFSMHLTAQENSPKWKLELKNKAKWMKILPNGSVLVTTNNDLHVVDPITQKIVWTLEGIGNVEQEDFTEIGNTPFAMFDSENPLKGLKAQTNIINFTNGRVIYNTKEENLVIREKTPLLDLGAILLEVKQDKKAMLVLVDIETGQTRWTHELPDRKMGIGIGALKQSLKSMLDATPVSDLDGNILFPDDKILKRIDGVTGKLLWQSENEKSVGRLNFSNDGAVVYAGAGKIMRALAIKDGKDLWKEPVKLPSDFRMLIPTSNNEMYVITEYHINRISNSMGNDVWKKPYTIPTSFQNIQFTQDGLLIFGSDDERSSFSHISASGASLWKRAYETDLPVASYELTSKGILFANAEEANMIDLKTGDDTIWKKRIKLKGSPVTYVDDKLALIYAEKKLFRVDMETLSYQQLTEEINFKGSDEDVQQIELVASGYLLSSQQNMTLVTPDGSIKYSLYYKPVSTGGTAGKILGTAAKIYATANSLEMTQDPNNPNTYNVQRSKKGDAIVGDINAIIANRKNSFATQDCNYIMTKIEDGENKRVGMVKIDKATGEEKGKIVLNTQDPIYEVDEPTGQLIVVSNGLASGCEVASFGL
ncbi:MAG TPA: PQQ-binding-like beta-propeller repeat protein [Chryseosolibacter sp.]|nr:PQQ-binding-like beta-propeller repeat protein [Chryseosolibacter sp.]